MVCGPIQRKENQHVMNERQSISISGKQLPENLTGEGASRPRSVREAGEGLGGEVVLGGRGPSPDRSLRSRSPSPASRRG